VAEWSRSEGIDRGRLEEILAAIGGVRAVLLGDLCLDVHWIADMTRSELSRETPHHPLPVVEETLTPGGGANAAANLAALRPAGVQAVGVVGRDWRGDVLLRLLSEAGVDPSGVANSDACTTNAYCKPVRRGVSGVEQEDPRIDFRNYGPLPAADEQRLIGALDEAVRTADVLCVADQMADGCVTPLLRERIRHHADRGLLVVVDSRDRIGMFGGPGVVLKPNEIEGWRAVSADGGPAPIDLAGRIAAAERLAARSGSRVCMTLGSDGCVLADADGTIHVPAVPLSGPIDFCGAGDTFLAAFSLALAAGASPREAAWVGNLAAAVSIRKIGVTGTADRAEVLAVRDSLPRGNGERRA
jgi:rfaE bifunctional protein kinase chain/domain